jgi:hypothetical protein
MAKPEARPIQGFDAFNSLMIMELETSRTKERRISRCRYPGRIRHNFFRVRRSAFIVLRRSAAAEINRAAPATTYSANMNQLPT